MCTFLELEVTFKNYVMLQGNESEHIRIYEVLIKKKVSRIRIKMLIIFFSGYILLWILPVLARNTIDSRLPGLIILAVLNVFSFIRLSLLNHRISKAFK